MPNKAFLSTFTQAWNDQDIDALMSHMHKDCAFYASVGFDVEGTKCEGWDEVKKGFASLWEGYPDARFEAIGEDFFSGDRGCCEWIFTGTRWNCLSKKAELKKKIPFAFLKLPFPTLDLKVKLTKKILWRVLNYCVR